LLNQPTGNEGEHVKDELIIDRIVEAWPEPHPDNEDYEILMDIIRQNERTISGGVTPGDSMAKSTGIPYPMLEKVCESDSMDLVSGFMRPSAEKFGVHGESPGEQITRYLVLYIHGFARGMTLKRNEDLADVVVDSEDFHGAMAAVFGDIHRPSVEYVGTILAVRMQLMCMTSPPEKDIWPYMAQWMDGFLCGWGYDTMKAVRNVG
jgi:hypothetical protein